MNSMEQLHLEIASAVAAIFERHANLSAPARTPLAENPRAIFLKEWRHSRAQVERVRHYRIFSNRTLAELARRDPKTPHELLEVPGIGPKRFELLGNSLLDALTRFRKRHHSSTSAARR